MIFVYSPLRDVACLLSVVHQFICTQCNKWRAVRHKHGSICTHCIWEQEQLKHHPPLPPSPLPSSSPSLSIFERPDGCIDQLTEVERAAIVTLHQVGWTGRDISHVLKCSENTVSLWVNRWKEDHSLLDKERSGHPRSTTDDTDQEITLYSQEHNWLLPKDIVRELELPISAHTIRRRLNEINIHTFLRRHEHAFTDWDLQRRLSFANGYLNWGEDEWGRVLWSDHTLFPLSQQYREYVQRPPGMGYDSKYIEPEHEHEEGAVWLWGCISTQGLGHAELYQDTLDAARYRQILSLNLIPSARTFWPSGMWYYQQDNASPHTAGTSQIWFHNHGVTLLDFPPYSSDLSPIENLWSDLKRRVYSHHPKTMDELENWIHHEWDATELDFISKICNSMPHRLQLCIVNKGHKIHY
jgi:transposase